MLHRQILLCQCCVSKVGSMRCAPPTDLVMPVLCFYSGEYVLCSIDLVMPVLCFYSGEYVLCSIDLVMPMLCFYSGEYVLCSIDLVMPMLCVQAGKGLLRSIKADSQVVADFIPVDLPVNMMVAVAWYTAVHKPKQNAKIYHITTGGLNPFTWGEMGEFTGTPVYGFVQH